MRQCVWGFAILILPRFTQSISDAIDQYRFDRIPRPKGQGVEPLLGRGCWRHWWSEAPRLPLGPRPAN
jgi:hypothetical protein